MTTQDQEKMSYKEASQHLGKPVNTLLQAISRGVLTPLPRTERQRYLPSAQVKLFKDKPLALSSLTSDEYQTWEETVKMATGSPPTMPRVIPQDSSEGYEEGKRFGHNYARGIYDAIRSFAPLTEEDLKRPLAV